MFRFLIIFSFCFFEVAVAQRVYTAAQAHSHNDYEQPFPFWNAWRQGFGSIEADIFLEDGKLIVAHEKGQLNRGWTLDSLYLDPLQQCIEKNNGHIYADSSMQLQLMVDIKTDSKSTLSALVEKLRSYPRLTQAASLKFVISGNKPMSSEFSSYPEWILFDGDLNKEYSNDELKKILMMSGNFAAYSTWNGKGRIPEKERSELKKIIDRAHSLGKKIRFWNSPDILNSWYTYIDLAVDYINTDDINGLSVFLKQRPNRVYTNKAPHDLYQAQWRNDGSNKPVKNIILLIGDGTGLAQWYAGYTANNAKLNVFNMRHTGLSKTSSFDNYITDSAPGATAFSSGTKTNNRAVGVDHTGKKLTLLPELFRKRKMLTGIITSGDLRDATPAAFYAHQQERSSYPAILHDLESAPIDIIAGACEGKSADSSLAILSKKFNVLTSISTLVSNGSRPQLVADKKAALAVLDGRGEWSIAAFNNTVSVLSRNKEGFFLMLEGAQIDHGGHANRLPYVVSELLDFDKVIGRAMEFADTNGETLVIVTADHETGGLTLTGGDYNSATISGQFSTGDHTAIPVPVFAYGPQSSLFDGVYENTAIFYKILAALKIKYP